MSCYYVSDVRKLAKVRAHEVAGTLLSGTNGGDNEPCAVDESGLRLLTAGERERLMGFPAGHTDVPGATDASRRRALGNSIAVNCLMFIGQRISEIE